MFALVIAFGLLAITSLVAATVERQRRNDARALLEEYRRAESARMAAGIRNLQADGRFAPEPDTLASSAPTP